MSVFNIPHMELWTLSEFMNWLLTFQRLLLAYGCFQYTTHGIMNPLWIYELTLIFQRLLLAYGCVEYIPYMELRTLF